MAMIKESLELDLKNTRTTLLVLDWLYNISDLDLKHYHYLTGLGLILLNTGLKLVNEAGEAATNVWTLSWIICFLSLSIALIHAVLTGPSFGNLCMEIYPSTLLFFSLQLWVSHVIVTNTSNTSRMFPHSLVQLIMSERIVQIQSSSISLGQILWGVVNMLMLLSSKS